MKENIFGKIRGQYDYVMAERVQRSLTEDFIATFRAIPPEQKKEALKRFNEAMYPAEALTGYRITEAKWP